MSISNLQLLQLFLIGPVFELKPEFHLCPYLWDIPLQ